MRLDENWVQDFLSLVVFLAWLGYLAYREEKREEMLLDDQEWREMKEWIIRGKVR